MSSEKLGRAGQGRGEGDTHRWEVSGGPVPGYLRSLVQSPRPKGRHLSSASNIPTTLAAQMTAQVQSSPVYSSQQSYKEATFVPVV